jgi:hypothetical protein
MWFGGFSDGGRFKAWQLHYQAKGASRWKATDLAWKKCQNKTTWPPGLQNGCKAAAA